MGSQRVGHDLVTEQQQQHASQAAPVPAGPGGDARQPPPLPTRVLSRATLAPGLPGSLPETFSEPRSCLGLFPLSFSGVRPRGDLMTLPPALPPRYYSLQAF